MDYASFGHVLFIYVGLEIVLNGLHLVISKFPTTSTWGVGLEENRKGAGGHKPLKFYTNSNLNVVCRV